MAHIRAAEQENKGVGHSYADLLHFLFSSAPVWIRGTLLLTLIGVIVSVVAMFVTTAFSGVALELGPLKISEYKSPLVRNCQQVMAVITSIQNDVDLKLQPLFTQMANQYAAANAMRKLSIEYRASSEAYRQPIGTVADRYAMDIIKEAEQTRQDILSAYNKISEELKTIRSVCLESARK